MKQKSENESQNKRAGNSTNIEREMQDEFIDFQFYQKIYGIEKQISDLERRAQENDHSLSPKEGKYYKEIQSGLEEYRRLREESKELGKRLNAMEDEAKNQRIERENEEKKIHSQNRETLQKLRISILNTFLETQ